MIGSYRGNNSEMDPEKDTEVTPEPEKPKPVMKFDDTQEKPVVIYGQDLQVPAFIRRQHD